MRLRKVLTPKFYKNFKCTGSNCVCSCCQFWRIDIDKKTHHKYINSSDREIRSIAKESMQLTRQGKDRYAVILLSNSNGGMCPFISEDRLCTIQQKLGAEALSHTCATYPRISNQLKNETRHSLTLSCNEVSRLVLFDENSMACEQTTEIVADKVQHLADKQPKADQVQQIIQLFAWNIIATDSPNIENNILALVHFTLFLQRLDFDLANRLAEVEEYYARLISDLAAGHITFRNTEDNHYASAMLKFRTLLSLGRTIAQKTSRDNSIHLSHKEIAVWLNVDEQTEVQALHEKFSSLNEQWQLLRKNSCLSPAYVMRNYLLYRLYTDYFPGRDLKTIMQKLSMLIMDYFYIKVSLSVKSMGSELKEIDVARLVADYSDRTKHSADALQALDGITSNISAGDQLTTLLLLY